MDELPGSIHAAAAALRSGAATSEELLKCATSRTASADPVVGAYIRRFDEEALAAAREADRELAEGHDRGPLHGIPIAVKDLIQTREAPTSGQSRSLDAKSSAPADAPVIARLREAGAVITGKTTLSEVALGLPDPGAPFPFPRNPWDLKRWAGGSSGGSAGSVAAAMALGAIGTDTGGSVRIPAGFCGVTALKPTTGTLTTEGCLPFAWSFDTVGPIARTAADCAVLLSAMCLNPVHHSYPNDRALVVTSIRGLRVGVDDLLAESARVDPGQRESFQEAVEQLSALGAEIVSAPLPWVKETRSANQVVMMTEAFTYHLPRLRDRWTGYGPATRTMLAGGIGYTAADYLRAKRLIAEISASVDALFTDIDVHVSPMATIVAPTLDDLMHGDLIEFLGSLHTMYWSTYGQPALSAPVRAAESGLPLAIQIAGARGADSLVTSVGRVFQQATPWHRLTAPLKLAKPIERSMS